MDIMDKELFHNRFSEIVNPWFEGLCDNLLNSDYEDITIEIVIGQVLMNFLTDEEEFDFALTPDMKRKLLGVAEAIGPDWAQAFYHASVFMTKVA